ADIISLQLFSPADMAEQLAGQYQAAITLSRIPVYVTLALFNAVFPYLARASVGGAGTSVYARLAFRYLLLFVLPIDVALSVSPDTFIRLFFSTNFDGSALPLSIAGAGTVFLCLVHALTMTLQAAGKLRLTAGVLAAGVVVQLLVFAWGVPLWG